MDAKTLIEEFEGCKLRAYMDQAGRVTIGYGHTGGVQMGDSITQEQAEAYLAEDMARAEEQVKSVVKVALTHNQLHALVSFTFNLGIGNLKRSGLLRYLNLREYEKAADQFPLWNKIGAYTSPGLTRRRAAERVLFLLKDAI